MSDKVIMIHLVPTPQGTRADIEAHGFTGDGEVLITLFDSVVHTASKMARSHNCSDPKCELQHISTIMANGLADIAKKLEQDDKVKINKKENNEPRSK